MPEMWLHNFDPDTARCTACGMPFLEAAKAKRLCVVRLHAAALDRPLTEADRIWQNVVDIARPTGGVPDSDVSEDRDFEPLEEELLFSGISPEI